MDKEKYICVNCLRANKVTQVSLAKPEECRAVCPIHGKIYHPAFIQPVNSTIEDLNWQINRTQDKLNLLNKLFYDLCTIERET